MSCVNRYTVRYFVKAFRAKYPYFTLTKILNITPRPIVKNNADAGLNNNTPCCSYFVEYTDTNNTSKTDLFALNMNLNGFLNPTGSTNNVFLYQPGANKSTGSTIFQPVPAAVPLNAINPAVPTVIPDKIPFPLYTLITPDTSCPGTMDCANFDLQTHLFQQFNERHIGLDFEFDLSGSRTYASILKAYTPNYVLNSGVQQCIYNVKLSRFTPTPDVNVEEIFSVQGSGSGYNYGSGTNTINTPVLGTTATITKTIKMTLMPVQTVTTDIQKCIYDLYNDDYPDDIWYVRVPLVYFDVPSEGISINPDFSKQTGVANCTIDCSTPALIQNLVTQFNKNNTSTKINSVSRSYAPLVSPSAPVCDYDVEMLRTNAGLTTVVNKETVRFNLKPTAPPSCMFDLLSNDSATSNSGLSLNKSITLGAFSTPYIWSSSFIKGVNTTLDNLLINVLGLQSVKVIDSVSKNALVAVDTILEAATLTQSLKACPAASCNDPYILQKILNRFNFNNYPPYPGGQYQSQKNSIIQFRRAAISLSQ